MRNISTGRICAGAGILVLAGTMWGCGGEGDSRLALASRTLASGTTFVAGADAVPAAGAIDAQAAAAPGTDSLAALPEAPQAHTLASRDARDAYGIVNLAPGQAFFAYMNARGQAAFEYVPPDYTLRVGFFDGERVQDPLPSSTMLSALGGMNERGELTIMARHLDPAHPQWNQFLPVRWSAAHGPVFLPLLTPVSDAYMGAINRRGDIAGFASTLPEGGGYRAARWTPDNRLFSLPGPAGFGDVFALDINDSNISVGYGLAPDGAAHALRWDAANRPTDMGTLGAGGAVAHAINARGDIAGMLDPASGSDYRAFLWSRGSGAAAVGPNTVFHQLNDAGQVVGRIQRPGNDNRAYFYSRARGLVNLHPRSFFASEANDLDERGTVVGLVRSAAGSEGRAWRWSRARGSVDLNTRLLDPPTGLVVTNALALSANGDIVANSNAGLVLLRHGGGGTDAPVVGPIRLPDPALNQPARLSLSFRDRNAADTHAATVDWGDGRGPQPAAVRESGGRGVVRATSTYTAQGSYTVVVRLTDSSGKTTVQSHDFLLIEIGGPALVGNGMLPDSVAAARSAGAAPMFRLAAPLAAGSATPFTFRLAGRVAFEGERLERATREGKLVRLEGTGRLNGRAGYRFTVDAVVGDSSARADRMAVRITGTGAGTQRVAFAAGGDITIAAKQPGATAPSGLLRQGSLRLIE